MHHYYFHVISMISQSRWTIKYPSISGLIKLPEYSLVSRKQLSINEKEKNSMVTWKDYMIKHIIGISINRRADRLKLTYCKCSTNNDVKVQSMIRIHFSYVFAKHNSFVSGAISWQFFECFYQFIDLMMK